MLSVKPSFHVSGENVSGEIVPDVYPGPAVTEVEREIPRNTVIGPAEGGLWYRTDALGEPLHISRRYFKDIEAADRAMGQAPA